MLPLRLVENFLISTPPHLQEIVLELRNIIALVAPDASEAIRWKGLNYFYADRGGIVSAGICQISLHQDHVRLDFIHGIFLPDPLQLFVGNQKAKRFIRLESYEDAPWDYLQGLISAAAKFDPRSNYQEFSNNKDDEKMI